MHAVIRIGTAGFAYKDWEGAVYPRPAPKGFDPLVYLAQFFDCIEMNVTFYRVPTAQMVERWVQKTAERPDFHFNFKLYRGLTHDTEDETLQPFLEGLQPCREAKRLGAVLLQFPFWFRNEEKSRRRLIDLAGGLAGWPCAVELRHDSWLTDPALAFLEGLGLNFCNIDICQTRTSVPPGSWATGPLGYVRLHGRNEEAWFDKQAHRDQKYDYLYGEKELDEWVERIRALAKKVGSLYVITNNHFGGKAVANAFQLARKLLGTAPEPPPHLQERFPELQPRE